MTLFDVIYIVIDILSVAHSSYRKTSDGLKYVTTTDESQRRTNRHRTIYCATL